MKLLITTPHGQAQIRTTDIFPRLGDNIDVFYRPYPKVMNVVLYPSTSLTKLAVGDKTKIDAIITVE